MVSIKLFVRLLIELLHFGSVFGLGFTSVTSLTTVGIKHTSSSFFLGSWRFGFFNWRIIGSQGWLTDRVFFLRSPLIYLCLLTGIILDDCSELEENMSLGSCGSWQFERIAYRQATGIPWVVCTSLGGRTVVWPRELLGFAIKHELLTLESIRIVCLKTLFPHLKFQLLVSLSLVHLVRLSTYFLG